MAQVTNPRISNPRIVGIATSAMLAASRYPEETWKCDGVELRADGLDPVAALGALEAFESAGRGRGFGGFTIFTLRLRRDGGAWDDARAAERETVWKEAARRAEFPGFVDVEIQRAASVPEALGDLRDRGRLLLSHHALAPESPAAWEKALAAMRILNPNAVKFAVVVEDRAAALALLAFARRVAAEFPWSCVLGMGEAGRATRALGPLLGCPIAYAFLEGGPVAPGQLSASALRAFFAASVGFDASASDAACLDWAESRLEAMEHAA